MNFVRRDLSAWAISFLVNLLMLVVMHNIVRELPSQPRATVFSVVDELPEQEYNFADIEPSDLVGNDGDAMALTPTMQAATEVGENRDQLKRQIEQVVTPTFVDFSEMADIPLQDQLASTFENRGQTDKVSGGVEGAMDRIAYEIAMSLKERQTLVLWLFDASGSLRDRRDAIADRFERVYKQLETRGKAEGLYTAVASYGESTNLLTPSPVKDVQDLVGAVRQVEMDSTGIENVFTAVYQTVDKWKTFRRSEGRWNKRVFIVTDERGDDIDRLEQSITLCKRYGVRVYAVGNAAIFGRREGFVDYREDDGYLHRDVVVDQGPESAFPEQVRLAFWGGGKERRLMRMSAGFGPYGLTRLCMETGGVFFITEENRGYQFDGAVMREYIPDYRPIPVIEQEIRQNPAKSALVQAARADGIDRVPLPNLVFRGDNDTILRQQITEAQKPLADFQYHIDRLHARLEQGMKARDSLKDPRWRAGFDLAMGRVLAQRVRAYGYNVMLANMKSEPQPFEQPDSNLWRLVPSDAIETGSSVRKAAEQATTLLESVVQEHAGTPWALLAERELRQPLGWHWREDRIDIDALLANNQDDRLLLDKERDEVAEKRPEPPPVRKPPKL